MAPQLKVYSLHVAFDAMSSKDDVLYSLKIGKESLLGVMNEPTQILFSTTVFTKVLNIGDNPIKKENTQQNT